MPEQATRALQPALRHCSAAQRACCCGLRIPTMPITSSDKPITDSGASRSPWRSEVHSGAGGSGVGFEV